MKREYEALSRLVGRNFAVLDDGNSVYLTPTGAVRDQDGKELLPAFPGRARLYERNLKQGGGASLPSAAPYQQLVTDGEGKWVPVDRLAWREGEKVEISIVDGELIVNRNGSVETVAYDENRYDNNLYRLFDEPLTDEELKTMVSGEFVVADMWDELVSEGNVTPDGTFALFCISIRVANANINGTVYQNVGTYFQMSAMRSGVTYDNGIIHTIPEEYLPAYGGIVFTYDGENYECNIQYKDFATSLKNGMPIVYVDSSDGIAVYTSIKVKQYDWKSFDVTVYDGSIDLIRFNVYPGGIRLPS